jgi:NADH:ubiquinone oxidoreductase subunit E
MPVSIFVCINQRHDPMYPSCAGRGGLEVLAALRHALSAKDVEIIPVHCFGHCAQGAVVRISGGEFFYHVRADQIKDIITALSV